jgi:hypothetical protein
MIRNECLGDQHFSKFGVVVCGNIFASTYLER